MANAPGPSDFLSILAAYHNVSHIAPRSTDHMTPHEINEYLMEDTVAALNRLNNTCLEPSVEPVEEVNDEPEVFRCDKCPYTSEYDTYMRRHQNKVHAAEDANSDNATSGHLISENPKETSLNGNVDVKDVFVNGNVDESSELYHCAICGFKCTLKSNLTKHVRTKHLKKEFQLCLLTPVKQKDAVGFHCCTVCDFKSTRQSTLARHVSIKHSKKLLESHSTLVKDEPMQERIDQSKPDHHCSICEFRSKYKANFIAVCVVIKLSEKCHWRNISCYIQRRVTNVIYVAIVHPARII